MAMLVYFVWVGLSVYLCCRLAVRPGKESQLRGLVCMGLGAVLILLPYWDVILGIPTMNKICSEEAGLQRRSTVKFPLSSVLMTSTNGPWGLDLDSLSDFMTAFSFYSGTESGR